MIHLVIALSRMAVWGSPDVPRIADIVVAGDGPYSEAVMVARSGLKVGMPASDSALETARQSLLRLHGLEPDPDDPRPPVEITREVHGRVARIVIRTVDRARIMGINVTGSGPIPPAIIMEKIPLKVGGPFLAEQLQDLSDKIRELYEEQGYHASLTDQFGFQAGILNIPIQVARVRNVTFSGLRRVGQEELLGRLKCGPGAYYNVNALRQDLSTIVGDRRIKSAEPRFRFTEDGVVDIEVSVREK